MVAAVALLLVGCASLKTSGGEHTVEKTTEKIQDVKACAEAAGIDEAAARAKPAAERSNQLDIEKDLQGLEWELKYTQDQLDTELVEQRQADAKLKQATELQNEFQQKMAFFYSRYNDLTQVANALADVTGDTDEGNMGPGVSTTERQVLEGVAAAATFLVAPTVGLGILIGDILGTENAEDRLRQEEKRIVQDMLSMMQEAQTFLNDNGYADGQFVRPISSAQTFIAQVDNPDREIKPDTMLKGMTEALSSFLVLNDTFSRQLDYAQGQLDQISSKTAELFAEQNETIEKINRKRQRKGLTLPPMPISASEHQNYVAAGPGVHHRWCSEAAPPAQMSAIRSAAAHWPWPTAAVSR
ncbi:MAG: hypothetical protein AUJ57_07075 [Zetaproteobacteria bacterium CG1_02_53_45]|nr:MAG: hypothetical protein AUJ57_07075 [Zetaproteobacteria bacterium CG1_02_53_45]